MPQTLIKADGLKLHVDKTFTGGEIPSKQIIVPGPHGNTLALTEGIPAAPNVHLCICKAGRPQFFYDNGKPLNVLAHTTHLPERMTIHGRLVNPRAMAEAFAQAQVPPADDIVEDVPVEVPAPALRAPRARRSRPSRAPRRAQPASTPKKIVLSGGVLLGTNTRPAVADGRDAPGLPDPS